MDIEVRRISTRTKLPFIPVRGNTVSLAVRMPKTLETTDKSRIVATVSGWALHELGVSMEVLASTEDPVKALQKAGLSDTGGMALRTVEQHNDSSRLKKAFIALRSAIPGLPFSSEKRSALTAKVDAVLAKYAETTSVARRF